MLKTGANLTNLLPEKGSASSAVHKIDQASSPTCLTYESASHSEFLISRGYSRFEDFWDLPPIFVDDINYRRGGWSGVSVLTLPDGDSQRKYFVKRQVNQLRYSISKPLGVLTFEHEVIGIKRNQKLGLPAIDIACWGVNKAAGSTRGLLVTADTGIVSLEELLSSYQLSPSFERLLHRCGEQLLEMHNRGIQHGALYPKHIFLDQQTGTINLIDFERARKKTFVRKAITADLRQLLKHLKSLPLDVTEMLLHPYKLEHAKLISQLQVQLLKNDPRY